MLVMMLNAILGYLRLRDTDYSRDDPMVLRVLGIHYFPDVSTISRRLAASDAKSALLLGGDARPQSNARTAEAIWRARVRHLAKASSALDVRITQDDPSASRAARRKTRSAAMALYARLLAPACR